MSDELHEIQNITHEYRKSLAAYEARTGRAPQTVDTQGSGEERQKFALMDADLSAAELLAQNKALEARLAKLEAQPMLTRQGSGKGGEFGTDEYSQRWLESVRTGKAMETRVTTTGTTNAPIPVDMERRIVMKMQQANVLRAISTVSQIDSDRQITVEGNLPTTSLVGESGAVTNSDPTFSRVTVTPYKFATRVIVSQEFLEDAIGSSGIGGGLEWLADRCAVSIGLGTEEKFTIGNPASEPQGICRQGVITQGINLGTGAALTTVDADDVIDVVHAVPPQYRVDPSFRWFVSDAFLKQVRKLQVAGSYVFSPAGSAPQANVVGLPGTIYGVPYSVGQYVPTTSTAENTPYAVVGAFRYFEIFDRTGIQSLVDPFSAAVNMQTNLYLWTRTDSKVMNADAFAAITS